METKNILFCGVGGQGVILAAKILLETASSRGLDVKESEIHGMAQRGGSVECHVRYGEKIHSPLIRGAAADFVVAFEKLESIRKIHYLKDSSVMLVNDLQIAPAPVVDGLMKYPDDIDSYLANNVPGSRIIGTENTLRELGSSKVLNVLMLGVLSNYLEFSEDEWISGIKNCVKEKFLDLNLKAFATGKKI